MNEQEIQGRIRELLATRLNALGLSASDVDDGMNLTRSGVLDSFALMELLGQIEEEFGVQLDFDHLAVDDFTSVRGMGRAFAKALAG